MMFFASRTVFPQHLLWEMLADKAILVRTIILKREEASSLVPSFILS
jgi:hypothetical protein